jgi:hypothetical protein
MYSKWYRSGEVVIFFIYIDNNNIIKGAHTPIEQGFIGLPLVMDLKNLATFATSPLPNNFLPLWRELP